MIYVLRKIFEKAHQRSIALGSRMTDFQWWFNRQNVLSVPYRLELAL